MSFVVTEVEFTGEDFELSSVEADESSFGEMVYAVEDNKELEV